MLDPTPEPFPGIEEIEMGADVEQPVKQKQKKKKEEIPEGQRWMKKYRGNRYFRRFFKFFGQKLHVLGSSLFNLGHFAEFLTEIFSLFTLAIVALSLYFSLGHLRSGNHWDVIAGCLLAGVAAWINHKVGSPNDESQS